MATAVEVRDDYSATALRAHVRRCGDPDQVRRLLVACEERIPKNFGIFNVRLAAGLRSGDGWLADFSALARLTAGSIG